MKIRAALGLDTRLPNQIPPRFNVLDCGETGLVEELEFRAGVVCPRQPHASRVVQYLNGLRAADSPSRFYHQTLATDPLACAETLLSWRDFALDHGWAGLSGPGSPGRLADLAEVEVLLDKVSASLGQRIDAVLSAAAQVASAIDEIELTDALKDWPAPLQRLLRGLETAGIPVIQSIDPPSAKAPDNCDLGVLQRALISATAPTNTLRYKNDGSLRSYSCLEGHAGANYLCATLAGKPDHLVIASQQRQVLNAAAVHRGMAEPGLGERSYWRAPSQLLPLLLQCAWSPPSAETLLQYLTLPAGRFQPLRRKLARLFTDLPGHNRAAWQEQVDNVVIAQQAADPALDEAKLRASIADWLPVGIAGSALEMQRTLAITLTERVKDYWRSRLSLTDDSSRRGPFAAALEAAAALAEALRGWDSTFIPREQLNRLLDIAGDGSSTPYQLPRELSTLNVVETPEAARLTDCPPAHLAWWGISLPREVQPPPFSTEELAALPDAPYAKTLSRLRAARLARALRPILEATHSATLMLLDDSPNLLRLHLEQYLGDDAWRPLESDLIASHASEIGLCGVTDLPLPSEQRWWHLEKPLDCPRDTESYSGLSSLAYKPHEYVLRYVAKIREGSIMDLPVDARLKGNLGHKLVEHWFEQKPWSGSAPVGTEIEDWMSERLDVLIQEFALPLDGPGQRSEKLRFSATMTHALQQLLSHLEQAGVVTIEVERHLQRDISLGQLEGSIDLLGRLADGRWVIVDMKWAGEKPRVAELKEGRFLQLATYAELARAYPPGQIAEVAYLILTSGNLLCRNDRVFPNATVVPPDDPALRPGDIWKQFENTALWRCRQLAAGDIEVTYGASATTTDSTPPSSSPGGTLPVIEIEEASRKQQQSYGSWKPSFKRTDRFRTVTGQITE